VAARLRNVLWWGGGIVGIAESTFPHPTGWTIPGTDCPLDKLSVKKLTHAFTLPHHTDPTCKTAWEKRLGPIDWLTVGRMYSGRLLSPKDYMTHFKLILHRTLLTRAHNNKVPSFLCRCCANFTENIIHLARCAQLRPIWDALKELFELPPLSQNDSDRFILLGLLPSRAPLARAYTDLWLITWKFVLINFTLVDLQKKRFDPKATWKCAVRRYLSKANALYFTLNLQTIQEESGIRRRDFDKDNKHFSPLATIAQTLKWRTDFSDAIAMMGLNES
jgi:hypothetical protein